MQTDLITPEEIRTAFTSRIEPVRTTAAYRLQLSAVLVTMIALQAIYIALVLLAAGATAWWIASMPRMFATLRLNWITVLVVLGPPIIGGIVTFFLFKPIFVRPRKPHPLPEISREEQPELFAFVDGLCGSVGVRPPAVIALTLDVNASASLRRDWLSLFHHDLRLTIGLPLVAGLSLRQLTGVLAHEFGHFSQTAGLRSWFLIQSIRGWFIRVANERDRWDDKLEDWKENNTDWRLKAVFILAEFAVGASRAVLRLLSRGAGMVSAGFSRQMEFNADHFEAAMVGADTFEATTFDMPAIQVAADRGWYELESAWEARRLVNDFPGLVLHHCGAMVEDDRSSIRTSVLAAKMERYDTHPSPEARIQNVRRRNLPGIFALDGPAHRLFRDFPGLCARVTESHYARTIGEAKERAERIAVDVLTGDMARERTFAQAREALLPEAPYAARWFIPSPGPGGTNIGTGAANVNDELYGNLLSQLANQAGGVALLQAGARIEPAAFSLRLSHLDSAVQQHAGTRREFEEAISALRASSSGLAGQIFALPAADPVLRAYTALAALQIPLVEIRLVLSRHRILTLNAAVLPMAKCANELDAYARRLREMCQDIQDRLQSVLSPLVLGKPEETLAEQLYMDGDAEQAAAWMLDRTDLIANRLLNRLCWSITSGRELR